MLERLFNLFERLVIAVEVIAQMSPAEPATTSKATEPAPEKPAPEKEAPKKPAPKKPAEPKAPEESESNLGPAIPLIEKALESDIDMGVMVSCAKELTKHLDAAGLDGTAWFTEQLQKHNCQRLSEIGAKKFKSFLEEAYREARIETAQ